MYGNVDFIRENIKNRKFFIDPNKKLKVVPIDYLYPDYIRLNKEKYSEWII